MNLFGVIRRILHYLDLESEVDDFDKIHESISKDIVFKGTNLWILMFAIIVASVGLNMNSTAVVIGAMLISPLMGPINGMGYSIATYNFPLFKKALKNFSFAVGGSLLASTTYFALSPISTAHSELLARTSPSIYDVLIALFGGLAGIVAISSRQKGNVIPGVAIATALMPPLCTAGYGLATGQFTFFFGAIYLFTINTVFIALSSVAISQILKFPIRTIVGDKQKKRINQLISVVIFLIIIPSIYFGYNLVQQEKFLENANRYVRNVSVIEGNFLLRNEIHPKNQTITLIYGGATLSEAQKNLIIEKAHDFSLHNAQINFQQGLAFDAFDDRSSEVETLKGEINRLNLMLLDKNTRIDSLMSGKQKGMQILDEIKSMYPEIVAVSYEQTLIFRAGVEEGEAMSIVVFTANTPPDAEDKSRIENWLKARLNTELVRVFYDVPGGDAGEWP
jgi:uncharacterized hydrophobic protein (TIGR00271 family)